MDSSKVDNPKNKTSYFSSLNPLKYANAKINAAKDSVNKTITNKINSTKESMNNAKKDAKSGFFSFVDKMKKPLESANKEEKNASSSSFKDKMKVNYQEWLKYGVFFILVGYALFIVVGLFGLPPDTLHNLFSFLTSFLDYFRLDYTSIGKPPLEEGTKVEMNFKKK